MYLDSHRIYIVLRMYVLTSRTNGTFLAGYPPITAEGNRKQAAG